MILDCGASKERRFCEEVLKISYILWRKGVGVGCGVAGAGEKMNMYVHIYPENDYLLKHSLIGFHNSFCAYSPFY